MFLFFLKNEELYYVSIISDRFLVHSVTIHYILQSNRNRNVVGSIRHVTCFHLEQYDKKIKIVCRFMLKVKTWPNMKLIEKYIKLRRIVKKLGLKKIKTKNILADCRKLKYQEKVLQNFSRLTMISSY